MSAIYSIFASPTHPPVPDHLPTLIVTPHGRPHHVLYTYLHTNVNRENYLLTPSDAGDLCVAKMMPPPPAGSSGSRSSQGHSNGSGKPDNGVKCEASRNLRWSISNTGIQNPIYKLTLPNPDQPQQDQPLFQVSKPNPSADWWTLFYFTYAGHLIPPKRIEFGRIQKNSTSSGGGTRVSITGKTEDEKAVWKTLGEGNEDMVEWIVVCAALTVLDDEILHDAIKSGKPLGTATAAARPQASGPPAKFQLHSTGNKANHPSFRGELASLGPTQPPPGQVLRPAGTQPGSFPDPRAGGGRSPIPHQQRSHPSQGPPPGPTQRDMYRAQLSHAQSNQAPRLPVVGSQQQNMNGRPNPGHNLPQPDTHRMQQSSLPPSGPVGSSNPNRGGYQLSDHRVAQALPPQHLYQPQAGLLPPQQSSRQGNGYPELRNTPPPPPHSPLPQPPANFSALAPSRQQDNYYGPAAPVERTARPPEIRHHNGQLRRISAGSGASSASGPGSSAYSYAPQQQTQQQQQQQQQRQYQPQQYQSQQYPLLQNQTQHYQQLSQQPLPSQQQQQQQQQPQHFPQTQLMSNGRLMQPPPPSPVGPPPALPQSPSKTLQKRRH